MRNYKEKKVIGETQKRIFKGKAFSRGADTKNVRETPVDSSGLKCFCITVIPFLLWTIL